MQALAILSLIAGLIASIYIATKHFDKPKSKFQSVVDGIKLSVLYALVSAGLFVAYGILGLILAIAKEGIN